MFEMLGCVVEDLLSSSYFLPPFLHVDDVYAKYMYSTVGGLNVYTMLPTFTGISTGKFTANRKNSMFPRLLIESKLSIRFFFLTFHICILYVKSKIW